MILQTNSLTKIYAAGTGCEDISLEVKRGQIFGLLGPNGAGKSTFVKMVVGLLRPTSGSGELFGLPIGTTESRRRIGYLPELFRFQDWLTGMEVLAYHACLSGMTLSQTRSAAMIERFKEVLHRVGIDHRGHDRVRQYSKGMQQRLGIACALLMDPELIILDEPSSALDPVGRHEVRELLESLRHQGKTVFLNTHLLEDVEAICDEVAFLHQGKLRAALPIDELLRPGTNWEIHVGGWFPDLFDSVSKQLLPGLTFSLKMADGNGEAVLDVSARNREQIGWLNRVLMEEAVTIYEVRPVEGRLKEWFLTMSGPQEEQKS